MKNLLICSVLVCAMFQTKAQNATQSTIAFNYVKGLNSTEQQILDSVYHNMKILNYHCFRLVSDQELSTQPQPKLLRLVKARAASVINYYVNEQSVKPENVFVKYGGSIPTLWLHKPLGKLAASGEIILDDKDRQCFSFNPSVDQMITSKNGNRYFFPPNAFETFGGMVIENQNINICVYEFMDKKSLVFSGLTTDANGKMLETAGSYYIEASIDGEKLRLAPGESYTVEMVRKKSFPDMFTYYGDTKDGLIDWTVDKNEPAIASTTDVTSQNIIEEQNIDLETETDGEWINFNDNNMYNKKQSNFRNNEEAQEYYESVEAVDFYEMTAGKLGWINCDRFYEATNTTTLAVRVDSDKPMVVRIVFRDINSVMPCYSDSNHKDEYKASGIPKGEKVLVLAYSVKDDNAILGYKEVTIGDNDTEMISLNNLSKSRFEGAVSELLSY